MIKLKECEKIIEPMLTPKRFYHSKCVSKSAGELAKLYGADEKKAKIAGMLHDIMKDTSEAEQLTIMKRFGTILSTVEMAKPKLWHAISGAVYIEHELKIDDPEIISAVRWHTTGHKNMTLLEKVIFIADFISEDRDYDGVEGMRKLSGKSLELAIIEGTTFTFAEQFEIKTLIGPDMLDAYNDAVMSVNKNHIGGNK